MKAMKAQHEQKKKRKIMKAKKTPCAEQISICN